MTERTPIYRSDKQRAKEVAKHLVGDLCPTTGKQGHFPGPGRWLAAGCEACIAEAVLKALEEVRADAHADAEAWAEDAAMMRAVAKAE